MAFAVQKYSFINAKLRTRLSKLLTDDFFDSLVRAHSLLDAMQLLKNTAYAPLDAVYSQTGDLKTAELELYKTEIGIFKDVENRVEGTTRAFCSALSTYYEVENLKRVVRLWFDRAVLGRDVEDSIDYLYRGIVHYDLQIDQLLAAGDYSGVREALSGTPYGAIFGECLPDIQKMNSIFAFEMALDKYYYAELLQTVENLGTRDIRIAHRLIGVEIDLLNINWVIRFKTLYKLPLAEALRYALPSGFEVDREAIARAYDQDRVGEVFDTLLKKHRGVGAMLKDQGADATARLVLIERILEYVLMREVGKLLVGYPFSVGIILAYFILKKTEIRRIMTILNAKQYGIKPEEIKSRL
ncbi:MAG: V-type ATPase subunit [Spirochaetales bacterium]|nr:V-type ATPase subunit [Spirochaetales bacterium]